MRYNPFKKKIRNVVVQQLGAFVEHQKPNFPSI